MLIDVAGNQIDVPDGTSDEVIKKIIQRDFAKPQTQEQVTAPSPASTGFSWFDSLIKGMSDVGNAAGQAPSKLADILGLKAPGAGAPFSAADVGRSAVQNIAGAFPPLQFAETLSAPQQILERQGKPVMEQAKEIAQPIAGQYYPSTYGVNVSKLIHGEEGGFNPEVIKRNPVGTAANVAMALAPLLGAKAKTGEGFVGTDIVGKKEFAPTEAQARATAGEYGDVTPAQKIAITDQTPLNAIFKKPETETDQYLKELAKQQEEAKSSLPSTIKETASKFYMDAKRKLVDMASPIEDAIADAQKTNKFEILPKYDFSTQVDRVLRAPSLAGRFAEANGMTDLIKNVPDLNALDQYAIAKHTLTLAEKGIETGRDVVKDKALVQDLAPQYDTYSKQLTDYSRKLLDYSVDSGLISSELSDKLKTMYPDYVPINRIMGELEQSGYSAPKALANLTKQTVVQKLEGSKRVIESPTKSLLEQTYKAFMQGEKNKAARLLASYSTLPGNPLELTPLRTAANVLKRISLFEEASDLKPIQNMTERFISTREGRIRELGREINKLEKQGLLESLKPKEESSPSPLVSKITIKDKPTVVEFGDVNSAKRDVVTGGQLGWRKLSESFATSKNRGPQSTRAFIEDLITDPNLDVARLKKMVATRENRLGSVLDEVSNLRNIFNDVKEHRFGLIDEARALKDAESRGKSTISFLNNGIKEIWETSPDVAQAAKGLNVQQLGLLGKIFALPTRIARAGITGLSLPFMTRNIIKDQLFAFVTSNEGLKTSVANPAVFVKALAESVKHGDVYNRMQDLAATGTSFDIARNQIPQTITRLRSGNSLLGTIKYTVKHPSELLRSAEDILSRAEDVLSRGEQLTRIQQFEGTKQALLSQGRTLQDAELIGAKAARENTANFMRRGEWGAAMNSAFLYLNAGIQGPRALIRAFERAPSATSFKLASTLLLPAAVITAYNLKDPARKKVYDAISDYDKDNSFMIVSPDSKLDDKGRYDVIKIPLPKDFSGLASITRKTVEAMQGGDGPGFQDFADAVLGTLTPLSAHLKGPNSLSATFTPQAVKPIVEDTTGYDLFRGTKYLPDYMSNLPPEKQAYPFTSGTAQQLGALLGWSPIKIQHTIGSMTGATGRQALNASDQLLYQLGIIPEKQISGENPFEGILSSFTKAYPASKEEKKREARK